MQQYFVFVVSHRGQNDKGNSELLTQTAETAVCVDLSVFVITRVAFLAFACL